MDTIHIDLDDVVRAGSVEAAICAAVEDYPMLLANSSAMGGQTFATSGPGGGWTRTFDAQDYARAAIRQEIGMSGCLPSDIMAINPEDGRVARGVNPEDGPFEQCVEKWDGSLTWSSDSLICLDVPSEEDALDYPLNMAAMARLAFEVHDDRSPLGEWRRLLGIIRTAAKAIEGIEQ